MLHNPLQLTTRAFSLWLLHCLWLGGILLLPGFAIGEDVAMGEPISSYWSSDWVVPPRLSKGFDTDKPDEWNIGGLMVGNPHLQHIQVTLVLAWISKMSLGMSTHSPWYQPLH